jgi:hypothetical protein
MSPHPSLAGRREPQIGPNAGLFDNPQPLPDHRPMASNSPEQLRTRLRGGEKKLVAKFSERISHLESWRPVFGVVAVVGALIAAIARAIQGDWGLGLTIFGALLAATGGALVVLMDYRKLEISQEAKDAYGLADDVIAQLEAGLKSLSTVESSADQAATLATAFDTKRLARIEAMRLMIESIEAALLNDADAETSAQRLLLAAASNLQRAVDYAANDFLTFTIFRISDGATPQRMMPIAREWTDRAMSAEAGRGWIKGEGYTGVLWSLAETNARALVVEPDTSLPGIRQKYPVPDRDEEREKRYRSVASFPILIGKENRIWGAVTATSDRVGVFDHSGKLARQGVETVRDVALAASLLAKLRSKQAK